MIQAARVGVRECGRWLARATLIRRSIHPDINTKP